MSAEIRALELRNRFVARIKLSIIDIGRHMEDPTFMPVGFWIDDAAMLHFRLTFVGSPLPVANGDDILQATTCEDLVGQLDEIIIIAGFGGLDDALIACAESLLE